MHSRGRGIITADQIPSPDEPMHLRCRVPSVHHQYTDSVSQSYRDALLTLVLAAMLVTSPSLSRAQAPGQEQQALEEVRQRIQALGKRLTAQHAQRKGTTRELRRVELELGATAQKLAELNRGRATQKDRQRTLQIQMSAARDRLEEQQQSLAQQIRLSYMGGRQEALRLLLNQESPARLGRMMVYYDYLNRARSAEIAGVADEIDNLARLSAAARRVVEELAQLADARQNELVRLERARAERRSTLVAIQTELKSADQQLASLQAEEQALVELIEELQEVLAEFPVKSQARFASLKGQLAWPVRGRVLRDYGARKINAGVTATGILVGATAGSAVRALYHGRVVFGDWLPGMGLLLVVDHGQGYMSLYGHNEALLKEAGDWVTPGEVVAQVGDSGGQTQPALYFEIRRDGLPENPHRWITRRLAAR